MGQGASQPQRGSSAQPIATGDDRRRRRRSSLGNFMRSLESHTQNTGNYEDAGGLLSGQQRRPPMRSNSTNRLSRLLHSSTAPSLSDAGPSRRTPLQRSRTTLSSIFRREDRPASRSGPGPRPHGILQHRTSYMRASADEDEDDYRAPRLPSIDQTSTFDRDLFAALQDPEPHPHPPRSSSSHRLPSIRFNSLRPDRSFRRIASSIARRRSPPPSSARRSAHTEDQAAMLSRLLSVAAAATAATLMGDDHQALSEARSLTGSTGIGDMGSNGEDGSFDGFLRALQNGRIASALRQGGEGNGQQESGEHGRGQAQAGALNFFRMFRFGASGTYSSWRRGWSHGSLLAAGITTKNWSAAESVVLQSPHRSS